MLTAPEIVGIALLVGGVIAFAGTYALVINYPKYLLGELTKLWFRCLTCIVLGGLLLLAASSLTRMIFTVLFWRR